MALGQRLGIEAAATVVQQNRLRRYRHVLRKDDEYCLKKYRTFAVEVSNKEKTRKTWQVVDKDMLELESKPGDGMDCSRRQRSRGIGVTVISGVIRDGCESRMFLVLGQTGCSRLRPVK